MNPQSQGISEDGIIDSGRPGFLGGVQGVGWNTYQSLKGLAKQRSANISMQHHDGTVDLPDGVSDQQEAAICVLDDDGRQVIRFCTMENDDGKVA